MCLVFDPFQIYNAQFFIYSSRTTSCHNPIYLFPSNVLLSLVISQSSLGAFPHPSKDPSIPSRLRFLQLTIKFFPSKHFLPEFFSLILRIFIPFLNMSLTLFPRCILYLRSFFRAKLLSFKSFLPSTYLFLTSHFPSIHLSRNSSPWLSKFSFISLTVNFFLSYSHFFHSCKLLFHFIH